MKKITITNRTVIIILICITIIAACLRLYGLDKQSLWYDEVYEEKAFKLQFLGDKTGVMPDTPPLHSLFVYPLTRLFPYNDFVLRLVPFTFGLISIPLFFLLGRKLFDEKVGLIASFLLAISPYHIWYSQEARLYAFYWMLALISLLYFVRTLERPNTGNFLVYILSTVAGLYTIQLSVFLLLINGVYILLFMRKYRPQLLKWVSAFVIIIVLYSPWIYYNLTYLMHRGASFPKDMNPIIAFFYTFFAYSAGFSIGPSLTEYHLNLSPSILIPYLSIISSLTLLYGTLFVLGLLSIRNDKTRLILLLLILLIPITGLFILINFIMTKMSYNVRYTGIAFFGYIMFVVLGVNFLISLKPKLLGRILSIFSLLALTGFCIYSYTNYQFDKRYHKPDIRSAAEYITEKKMSGDIILSITSTGAMMFKRYSKKPISIIGFPPSTNPNSKKDIEADLQKIVVGKKRLWLILYEEWGQPTLASYTKSWLDTNYEEIKHLHKGMNEIANIKLYCYDLTKNISQNEK